MRILITYYGLIFILLFSFTFTNGEQVYGKNNPSGINTSAIHDSSQNRIETDKSLGLQTELVFIEDFDAGFGFGARYGQRLFYKFFHISSSLHFWGASSESIDIAVLGIDGSMMHYKHFIGRLSGYTGLTLGYYFTHEKTVQYSKNSITIQKNKKDSFETYITAGITYSLQENRAVYLELSYGLTTVPNELHVILGFNFDPKKIRKSE